MKVKMLKRTNWQGNFLAEGSVINVDKTIGARWIDCGIAEEVKEKKSPPKDDDKKE